MNSRVLFTSLVRRVFVVGVTATAIAGTALAQTTTGTIRGYVRGPGAVPMPGAIVSARNTDLNVERAANSNDAGFYALSGLRPGQYELSVRRLGAAPQTRNVRVLIGQTLDLDFNLTESAVTLTAVEVVGTPTTETQTSEIAT